MTDRPIPFSPPMVRAILREIEQPGTGKTQTRRVIEPTTDKEIRSGDILVSWPADAFVRKGARFRPRYRVGDRLWVREAWRTGRAYDDLSPSEMSGEEPIQYEAGPIRLPLQDGRYRHARFMPRWASRLTLLVKEVRVERLQDISEEDARAEGVEWRDGCYGTWNADGTMRCGGSPDPREAFRCLWINIHGPGSWEANPWVAVYGFQPILANIDNMEAAHG